MKIEELIEAYLTDWDLTLLPDGAEPRIIPSCGQIRTLLKRIKDLKQDVEIWKVLHGILKTRVKELESEVGRLENLRF